MEKKLKISLDLDDKTFSAAVKRMQDELKKINSSPQIMQMQNQLNQRLQSMGGLPGAPGYDKMVQERRRSEAEQKKWIQELLKSQERLVKNEERLTKLKDSQIKSGKDIKDTEKTLADISDRKLKNEAALTVATEKRVRSYKELLGNMSKEFKMGGFAGLGEAWKGMSGLEKGGFAATTAGGAIGAVSQVIEYMARRPIDIARMQGSAVSGLTGLQMAQARTGEYTYEGMYGEDRKKAAAAASKARGLGEKADWAKLIGGAALAAGALALAIPSGGLSLGTGAALAAGGTLAYSSLNKGILDSEKYKAYQAQQYTQDFSTVLSSEHEMNPLRKAAIDRLKDTSQRDLSMQRTLGLGDAGYLGKGGYLHSQMDLGFTDQLVTGASQGILGARGSTAMAKQSGMALQAERGLGLTNAPQLLGMLSGTQTIPETSKKSLIDIFAHGLDASKYAEENRKFIENVAQQISMGGSTSEDAADKIAAKMSGFLTGTTSQRGIEAAKTAYEAYQQTASSTTGYTGGINVASAMSDPYLSKIKDAASLDNLIGLKDNEISESNPSIIDAAAQISASGMKVSPQELADKLRNRQGKNVRTMLNRSGAIQSGASQLSKYRRAHGGSDEGFSLSGETGIGGAIGMAKRLNPNLGDAEAQQYVMAQIKEMADEMEPEYGPATQASGAKAAAAGKMESKDTGRSLDTIMQASAINAKNSLETLSDSINKFAQDTLSAAKLLHTDIPGLKAAQAATDAAQGRLNAAHDPDSLTDWRTAMDRLALETAKSRLQKLQENAGIPSK